MKLSGIANGLLSVAFLTCMVTDVLAQDGNRPGNRGAQRGGPGGGNLGGRGGRGGDPIIGLLLQEKVKEEIELMPDQEQALKKIGEQTSQRGERPNFDFRNASDEDRRKFFEEMQARREESQKKVREQLEEVLLPGQIERLEQIALQVRGVGALSDEKLAEKLGITAEQKKKLEQTRESVRGSMQERMQDPKIREIFASRDREAIQKALAGVREDFDKQMFDVLTSSQKTQFEEMKGKPFEIPAEMRGFGGGGFGGGGPGGGAGFGGRGGPGGGGDRQRQRPATEE